MDEMRDYTATEGAPIEPPKRSSFWERIGVSALLTVVLFPLLVTIIKVWIDLALDVVALFRK